MSDGVDNSTRTRSSPHRCGLTLDRALKLFSSFLIPLLLSIFTIVIAVYQQKIAHANRMIDIQAAKEQRDQDQKLVQDQKLTDKNTTLQKRLEDKRNREKQREQDRSTFELQRDTDINSTTSHLEQERILDEQTRSITARERKKTFQSNDHMKQEEILEKFVREVSTLIINLNDTIPLDILHVLRWKTFVAIRQLDSKRKTLIFINLYEAGLLDISSEKDQKISINLVEGHFDGIDLSSEPIAESRSLSFRGMSMINAKIEKNSLSGSDFSFTQLIGISFKYSILNESTFYSADLTNSSFIGADVRDCDFTDAILIGSDITMEQLNNVTFLDGAILPNQTKFEQNNFLWIDTSLNNGIDIIRPFDNYKKPNFFSVWNLSKDIDTDPQADIEEENEWTFKAKAQYRVSLKSSFKRRIPTIYDKWIKTNSLKMRFKTQCRTLGENTTISYFIYYYNIDNNSSFANFSFGPIQGNTTVESIDYIPVSERFVYDIEFVFERSKPSDSAEYIGLCENVHLSFVIKHFK